VIPGIERVLLYTSGYPDDEWEAAEDVAQRLPADWHERVFRTNAEEFFRWPERLADADREAAISHTAGGQ
jgi:predicted TIM-barrel fold metal-dependent hydrolase